MRDASDSRRDRPTKGPALAGLIGLAFAGALARLLPHPPNVAPVAALALFGGGCFPRLWMAAVVTLGSMVFSDALLYATIYRSHATTLWGVVSSVAPVYAAFGLTILLGRWLCREWRWPRIVAASVLASLSFFLITNFFVWYGSTIYPPTPAGLWACYVAALPFLRNTLFGDLFFTSVLFGLAFAVRGSWRSATQAGGASV